MKILITGNRGFIGSNAVKYFSKNHIIKTYEWGEPFPDLSLVDWVMHFGANSSTTERDVEKIMKQNYDFSCRLLDRCMDRGIKFQYSSSASVYGLGQDFKETANPDPRNPYAWSKYLFERYTHKHYDYANFNNYQIQGFRYFNVYGPGEDHKGTQASPYHQFKLQAQTTGEIRVFEGSDQYLRDFVPVETVIKTHERFLSIEKSGIWNVGTGKPKSFLDVATEIADEHKAELKYIPMPEVLKGNYQEYTCADISLLERTIYESNG